MTIDALYENAQIVALRSDPSRSGAIIEIVQAESGGTRYKVFHGPGDIWEYDQDQLVPAGAGALPPDLSTAIRNGDWLSASTFKARLTASRLTHPEVDSLYALQAARIQFIPFQLKPLLRFLHADRPRLLIADEVGVGKTIEAGLILKELQTRQRIDNVLIVCPKALVSKWRTEMRRFDEDFRPLDAGALDYCLRETYRGDGEWPHEYARSIAHLELLRNMKYLDGEDGRRQRPGLRTLDPAPRFDLIIVDEAHHVRNPGTNSYALAKKLCEIGDAVLFLSATPVHVGATNLFSLLHLLREDLFQDIDVFADVIEPNRYLGDAMRHVRTRIPSEGWQGQVAGALRKALGTRWGAGVLAQNATFKYWLDRLAAGEVEGDEERVRCLRELEELHSLAQVMNRTRRRDIGQFTIREPRTVEVPFTPEGERLYNALISFRQEVLKLEHDPRVVRLISDTLERQAASCLPALLPAIDRVLSTRKIAISSITDAPEEEELEETTLPPHLVDRARELRTLAAELPAEDPKLERLLEIAERTQSEVGPGKLLVFSFFLHTLSYLRENLSNAGYRVAMITGATPDEMRESLRDRFRLPREHQHAIDVLLSSEVGCEGLDYEFCDRLVNYDIPWNPMRIEQRIGRIDRFGQQSAKVFIFNFITPGTVEERIFYRCFERLGVFRTAVGDLEEVLGDLVQELNRTVLDPDLTPRQAEERASQTADNALRIIVERNRLEEEGGGLLGLDEAYMEEINELLEREKFVRPDDLREMIGAFLADPSTEGRIEPVARQPGVYRMTLRRDARNEIYERLRELRRNDRLARGFQKWLQGTDSAFLHTYEQSVALERREIPFITPVHPLAKLAIDYWDRQEVPLAAQLVVEDGSVPEGLYLFACDLWKSVSLKPEVRLVGAACNLETLQIEDGLSSRLLSLLRSAGEREGSPGARPEELDAAFGTIDADLQARKRAELVDLQRRNADATRRQLLSLDSYYKSRLERLNVELSERLDERIARMKESERERAMGEYVSKRKEIKARENADIVAKRIAAGVLEVRHAE